MRFFFAPLVFAVCSACAPSSLNSDQPVVSFGPNFLLPDSRLIELLEEHEVPGMSYVRLRSCHVDVIGQAGTANVEDETQVEGSTVFEAASLSKPVFAWLVVSLAEDGVIDLDRTFADANFEYARISDRDRYNVLTPRHVLMHRTGLPNWSGDSRDPERSDPLEFLHDPGSVHSYSGEAYLLLQSFIEQKTGRSLQAIFRERLGSVMPNSTFVRPLPPGTLASRGYYQSDAAKSDLVAPFKKANAAYSLSTTAADFGKFMSMACSGENLSPDSHMDMLKIQTEGLVSEGSQKRWRLGWEALDLKGRDTAFHTGDNGNYMAMAILFLDDGEGYAVFTNAETGLGFINDFLREIGAGERND